MEVLITKCEIHKGDTRVWLDANPFYPAGGGQPGDMGKLICGDAEIEVKDCRSADGDTYLLCAGTYSIAGCSAQVQVDSARHAVICRMHSGEHILSRALEDIHSGLHVTKVNVDTEESLITMDYDGVLSWETLFEAEDRAMEVIARDAPVTISVLTRDEVLADERLRANWGRIESDSIRVVDMGGYDIGACCGSHVTHTADIGGVLITGFKGSGTKWEVKYTVHRHERMQEWSRPLRRLCRALGAPPQQLETVYANLTAEKAAAEKRAEKLKSYVRLPFEHVMGTDLWTLCLDGLGTDVASPQCKEKITENPGAVAVALCSDGGRCGFIVCRGGSVNLDLRTLLTPHLECKGGGGSDWISGVTQNSSINAWRDAVIKALNAAKDS